MSFYGQYPYEGPSTSNAVTSLNGLTGALTLLAGANITITPSGNTLTITSSGSGGGGISLIGTFDSEITPSADALTISGSSLIAQSASVSVPGMVNIGAQSFAGAKTFTGAITASNLTGTNSGDITIGTANGLTLVGQALSLGLSSTSTTGALSSTDWNTFNNKQSTITTGNLTSTPTTNLVITGGTGAVIGSGALLTLTGASLVEATSSILTITGASNAVLGTGVSIAVKQAATAQSGYLSSADWNTFNGKQAAGNYITALTGDGTASGPNSAALTLAIVNTNVGSFGDATHVTAITVNGKGLITAAASTLIQIAESQVTNLVSDLAGKQATGNYITALTGDITASGPGSVVSTLATVNSNVGSFTNANITVNAKGLITAAANGSAGAAIAYNYTAQTTTYAASINDYIFCSGASFTVTLPTAVGNAGKSIVIQHNGTSLSQLYTLATTSAQTIGGIASGSYILATNAETLTLISDGANYIIQNHETTKGATNAWTPMFATKFTVTAANATIGAVYTNNGQTFVVAGTIAAGTTLQMVGTGNPAASGSLSKSSGTGDASITFSTSANSLGTVTTVNAWWMRYGNRMKAWGSLLPGTATGNLFMMSLPGAAGSPVVLDTTLLAPASNTVAAAGMRIGTFQASGAASAAYNLVTAPGTYAGVLFNANILSGTATLTPQTSNTGIASGALISWDFDVPISGWQP